MSVQLANFLRKENKVLKEQNQELKDLLELNRKALHVAVKNDSTSTNFSGLINLLYEQNSKLHKKVAQMKIQLENGMCQALISDQIAFASTQQEKNLTSQLRDKLSRMRKELENRDKKIIELSKEGIENKADTKIVQITQLNLVTKKLKDQIADMNNEIDAKKAESNKYKEQKEDLLKLNLLLTKQINELKIISSHQSTNSNDYNRSSQKSSHDLSKFLNYQKKIVADEDSESEDYEGYSDSSGESSSDVDIEESLGTSQISANLKPKAPKLEMQKIPKLELSKAKEIQDLIVQKLNQDGKKKNGTVKQEKYKKLQHELTQTRKKIGFVMMEKIELQRENNFLTKIVKQLQTRNQLLLNSYETHFQVNNMQKQDGLEDTETLIDICRDVTLNKVLKEVLSGQIELQCHSQIKSYDI